MPNGICLEFAYAARNGEQHLRLWGPPNALNNHAHNLGLRVCSEVQCPPKGFLVSYRTGGGRSFEVIAAHDRPDLETHMQNLHMDIVDIKPKELPC